MRHRDDGAGLVVDQFSRLSSATRPSQTSDVIDDPLLLQQTLSTRRSAPEARSRRAAAQGSSTGSPCGLAGWPATTRPDSPAESRHPVIVMDMIIVRMNRSDKICSSLGPRNAFGVFLHVHRVQEIAVGVGRRIGLDRLPDLGIEPVVIDLGKTCARY